VCGGVTLPCAPTYFIDIGGPLQQAYTTKGDEDLTISEIAARRAASGIKCTGSFRFVISRTNATLSH